MKLYQKPFPFAMEPHSQDPSQWAEQLLYAYQATTGEIENPEEWPDGVLKDQSPGLKHLTGRSLQEELKSQWTTIDQQVAQKAQQKGQLWNVEIDRLARLQNRLFPRKGKTTELAEHVRQLKRWIQLQDDPRQLEKLCRFQSPRLLEMLAGNGRAWSHQNVASFLQQRNNAGAWGNSTGLAMTLLDNKQFPTARFGQQILEDCHPNETPLMMELLKSKDLSPELAQEIIKTCDRNGHLSDRVSNVLLAYNPHVYQHPQVLQTLIERLGSKGLIRLAESSEERIWERALERLVRKYPDDTLQRIDKNSDDTLFQRLNPQHLPHLLQAQNAQNRARATRLVAQLEQRDQTLWKKFLGKLKNLSRGGNR